MTPDQINEAYAQALDDAARGVPSFIPLGRTVVCDGCDEDLTDDARSGGFMFDGSAIGPCCAARRMKSIRGYGEERHIRANCPTWMSFADWVRGMRGPDAGIKVTPGPPGGLR